MEHAVRDLALAVGAAVHAREVEPARLGDVLAHQVVDLDGHRYLARRGEPSEGPGDGVVPLAPVVAADLSGTTVNEWYYCSMTDCGLQI